MMIKLKIKTFAIVFLSLFAGNVLAQVDTLYYLISDFEDATDQSSWTSNPSTGDNKWQYLNGGALGSPAIAASGSKNAHFNYVIPGSTVMNNLVSPKVDLSDAQKPRLAFQYSQPLDVFENRLAVLFKAGDGAPWDTIRRFDSDVNFWEEAIFNIDEEGSKYLVEDFQVAFLAMNKWNNGVSVDSIVIQEQDTIPKFVKAWDFEQVDNMVVTSKAAQIPLIKLRINISGNDGPINLRNVAFQLNGGDPAFFKTNGFKIFHTIDDAYSSYFADSSTQVGSAVSISGTEISFTGLEHPLKIGDNFIWLTADFADVIDNNSYFSFGVDANSFRVNDTILPAAAIDDISTGTIKEALFFDNFTTNTGWITEGDFEIAVPLGFSGSNSRDPDHAFSGTKVLGTDLTSDGYYTTGITSGTGYYAYSPVFNMKYYNNGQIYMRMWNDIYIGDSATMAISTNGGSTWEVIWISYIDDPSSIAYWKEKLFTTEVKNLISKQETVQFRFGIDETGSNQRFGFNIDQFTIVGNHLDTDVGVTEIISPFDDCIGFNNDTVKIVVKNYADGNSPERIPVFYAPWGLDSTIVRDTIEGTIAKDDSVIFTFSQVVNFPRGDIYDNFTAGIELAEDEDASNDLFVKTLYIQDSHVPTVLTDFEYKGGVWIPDNNDIWECKIPGSFTPLPGSENSWLLYPNGNYANSDLRTVTSACYDLTGENQYILQLKYYLETGDNNDGFAIEYSTNEGASWNLVDTSVYGRNWGWYTNEISSLGHIGWTGTSGGWLSGKELLPNLSVENKVKFRVKWASDASGVATGLAFDDFELFPAPIDVGISAITQPDSACQFVNTDTVHIYVKNYGANDMKVNDTLIIGVDFESEPAVIDTVQLTSDLPAGDSVLVKFPLVMDIDNPGIYNLAAYTLIENDPFFYGSNNDTLSRSFTVWPNPTSGMADSLFSRQPDTLEITPHYEVTYSYLWFDMTTAQTHPVNASDMWYSVTITESDHGCQTMDSTYVQLLFNDVGIDEIVSPISSCELTGTEDIIVAIKNKGTDSLIVGDQIFYAYTITPGDTIENSITLTESLYKGDTIHVKFDTPNDFSSVMDYEIKTYTRFGGDTVRTNDTVLSTIQVFGYTPIDLGPDYSIKALTETLDAGASFSNYLWSTGDTTQTTVIDTSGKFWVDVWDVNGCDGSDTINVFLKIRDIKAELLQNPTTDCDRLAEEVIEFIVYNNGTDTLTSADTIFVDYRLDGGDAVVDTIVLGSDLIPGDLYTHNFGTTEDLSVYSDYTFELTARTAEDLRTSNDTMTVVISTYETPSVYLGSDQTVNGYEYVLDAGAGTNYSYLWNDGSTNQTFTATQNGYYWVTVTNSITGCFASDTILLTFDITDYAVQSFNLQDNLCGSVYEGVKVYVLNNGNTTRTNAVINVGFYVGTEEPIVEEHTISGDWTSLSTREITLNNPISLQERSGPTDVTVYLDQAGDLNSNNDALTRTLNVTEAPTVPIDGDTIETSLPYTIDATAPGDDNYYLWNDVNSTTTPTLNVDAYGQYTVTVSNSNGCYTIAHVWIAPTSYVNEAAMRDLEIALYPNPAQDVLNIDAELKTGDEFIIEMYDITNRVVFSEIHTGYSKYENRISVAGMNKGIYFIRIRNKEIYYVKRIIVN